MANKGMMTGAAAFAERAQAGEVFARNEPITSDVAKALFLASNHEAPSSVDGIFVASVVADGTDQSAIINAALADPAHSVVMLPPGEFWISSSIVIPEGKTLIGSGQDGTLIKILPDFGPLPEVRVSISVGDNGTVSDLSIDVDKTNNGDGLSARVHGVQGNGTGYLVENVSVLNATGYAFWSLGASTEQPASGVFRDCYAENSNILFETQFSDGVLFENCVGADGDNDVHLESAFHPLVNSHNITFLGCVYIGDQASISVDAVGGGETPYDQSNIVFENCYLETTSGVLGAFIGGPGNNEVMFLDTILRSAGDIALVVSHGDVTAVNSRFESGVVAVHASSGSTIHLVDSGAVAIGNPDFAGASFAAYGAGEIIVDGGFLYAEGVPGSAPFTGDVDVSAETSLQYGSAALLGSGPTPAIMVGSGAEDRFTGQNGNDLILGFDGNDQLTGGNGLDTIFGGNGADRIVGGAGIDFLDGGAGDDLYYVEEAGDVVAERAGGGRDTIFTSVSYTLSNAEVEVLSTRVNADTAAINLTGNDIDNFIWGNAGVNILNGRGGADRMIGFAGDDIYYVDRQSDVAVEQAGQGYDTIFTSANYMLSDTSEIEALSAVSQAAATAINLSGNSLANTLFGNAGVNRLDGRGGADTLIGYGGDDLYFVDNANDVVIEQENGGRDTVFASVDYTLAAYTHVEALSAASQAATTAINLTGNGRDNTLYGNSGQNVLDGGSGNDILIGYGGADTFAFTTALNAATNVDHISDFSTAADRILLGQAVFQGLAVGTLGASAFTIGSAATTAAHRIVYNNITGALLFDSDGAGGQAAVQFATLTPGLGLTASHFEVSGPASVAKGVETLAEASSASTFQQADEAAFATSGSDAAHHHGSIAGTTPLAWLSASELIV